MKIIKPRLDLVFYFFFPFTLLSILFYFIFKTEFAELYKINWLLLGIVLILFILNPKKINLKGASKPKTKFWFWISLLFIIQLFLNFFLWGITYFILNTMPVMLPANLSFNFTHFYLTSGLFPSGFLILFTLLLSYFIYYKQDLPFFSSTFKPLFHNTNMDSIGIAVDSYARLICHLDLILCATFLCLGLLALSAKLFSIPIQTGFKIPVIILNTLLLFLYANKTWLNAMRGWLYRLSALLLVVLSVIFFTLILLLGNKLFYWLLQNYPSLNTQIFSFEISNWQLHLKIIITFFGLGFAMLAGALTAFLSQGYSLRQIIFFSAAMNILGLVVVFYVDRMFHQYALMMMPAIILLICIMITLGFFLQEKNLAYLIRAELPTTNPIKPRSAVIFLRTIIQSILLLLTLYLLLGINIFSFMAVFTLLPSLIMAFISILGWIYKVI